MFLLIFVILLIRNITTMHIRNIHIEELDQKLFVVKDETEVQKNILGKCFLFNGFILGLCTQGTITMNINSRQVEVFSQQLFIILPRHLFTIKNHSSDLKLNLIFLSLDFLHQLPVSPDLDILKKTYDQPIITLCQEKYSEITSLNQILLHYSSENKYSQHIQASLIYSIILIVISEVSEIKQKECISKTRQEELVHKFFKLLFEEHQKEYKVTFYAEKLYISPKYLSSVVKKISGYTVQDWINEFLQSEAKRYLHITNLNIQQIAEKMHFTNASSFIRFFKKQTQITPSEYRKTIQNK